MSSVTELKLLIDDLVDTSASTFSEARKVRGLNTAQTKIVNLIMEKDTLYEWDDYNYSDLNEGYLDIVSGQDDYDFREDENNAKVLFISDVWIKRSALDTDYYRMDKIGTFSNTDTGVPQAYRASGKRIIFNKIFDYSLSDGIKLNFIREPIEITVSDTTKKPGIPDTFHHLMALYVAYDYASTKTLANTERLYRDIITEEKRLGIYVKKQMDDHTDFMSPEPIDSV